MPPLAFGGGGSCNPQLQPPLTGCHTRAPVLIAPFVLMSARRGAAGLLGLAEGAKKAGTVAELNLQLGKLKPQGVRWVCQGHPAWMGPNGAQLPSQFAHYLKSSQGPCQWWR